MPDPIAKPHKRPMFSATLVAGLSMAAAALALAATPAAPPAAASEPKLSLQKAKLAEMRPGEMRALYLIIENKGAADDRLLGVTSAAFGRAVMVDQRGQRLSALGLPAGETRALGPSGDAILVLGAPEKPWIEGDQATLEFSFERAGRVELALRAGPRPSGGFSLTLSDKPSPASSGQGSGKAGSGRVGEPLQGPQDDPRF